MAVPIVMPVREKMMLPVLQFMKSYRLLFWVMTSMIAVAVVWIVAAIPKGRSDKPDHASIQSGKENYAWVVPDSNQVPHTQEGELIRYGRKLIANTSFYFGPKGKIATITNGMNCQNCHLDAGTRLYGNNYSAVFSTYPKFRERSGTVENIYKRINDCLERSLNGRAIDTNSREMQAIAAYIEWLGKNVPKDVKPAEAGITNIPFLNRAADPAKGKIVYVQKCQRCHGRQGEGLLNVDNSYYTYPPLWGKHSYTTAAGLYRVSRLAGYIKDNMPFGVSHHVPQLSNEEAWDVAAFISSQPRPEKIFEKDWPDISGKPIDHPFGPYTDSFSQTQHKYGPFGPIRKAGRKGHG
jgi:thiosulfate dehydrogenase